MNQRVEMIVRRFPRRYVIAGAIGLLIIICLAAWALWPHSQPTTKKPAVVTPPFSTLLPAGTTIDQLGGWSRNSPKDSAAAYAYRDTLEDVTISVSEQQVPPSLADGQLADLAAKANYADTIKAGTTTAYIGTSAKGPQSVMFIKSHLFVTIKSDKKISDTAWARYIKSLE